VEATNPVEMGAHDAMAALQIAKGIDQIVLALIQRKA
jgi:hypothetical protein